MPGSSLITTLVGVAPVPACSLGTCDRDICSFILYLYLRLHSQGTEVALVSRGDSTLRGHFPEDLLALEKGMGGESAGVP